MERTEDKLTQRARWLASSWMRVLVFGALLAVFFSPRVLGLWVQFGFVILPAYFLMLVLFNMLSTILALLTRTERGVNAHDHTSE